MRGIVKSVSGNVITFDDDSTHECEAKASVTCNGKACKLSELKAGDSVSLTGDPATVVSATRTP